jgi:hypothetical protein
MVNYTIDFEICNIIYASNHRNLRLTWLTSVLLVTCWLKIGNLKGKKKNAQANDDANIRPAVLKRSASAAMSCRLLEEVINEENNRMKLPLMV